MNKHEATLQEFNEAVQRLDEVLQQEKSDIVRDAAIKRFELTFDLSWKAVKARLEEEGTTCASPLMCFKEAYRRGFMDFEETWVAMVKTRNKTVHTYDLDLAEEVYVALPDSLAAFKKLVSTLSQKEK